jgi:hypothetical protein
MSWLCVIMMPLGFVGTCIHSSFFSIVPQQQSLCMITMGLLTDIQASQPVACMS